MKFVLNKCYGGFSLSKAACECLGCRPYTYYDEDLRSNPELLAVIEKLGDAANGAHAKLRIVDLPDGITDWEIDEYDGVESITYVLDGRLHHI